MKKYFFKLTAVLLVLVAVTGCEEDRIVYDGSAGNAALASFRAPAGALPVSAEQGTNSIIVVVDVSTASDVERTIDVSVDSELSTALPNQYTISDLVIPAGAYNGEIKITTNYDQLVSGEIVKLYLNLNAVGDAVLEFNKTTFQLSIFQKCPVVRDQVLGTYDGEELPGPYNYVCEITAGAAANEIVISNVWEAGSDTATHIFLNPDAVDDSILSYPADYHDNYLADIGTYGPGWVEPFGGNSTIDACQGIIILKFRVRVGAGTFTPNTLTLVKQ